MGNPNVGRDRPYTLHLQPITHDATGDCVTMATRRLPTSEAQAISAHASLTATCVQNFWIILGKYLNVKLTAHITQYYSRRFIAHWWSGCVTREARVVSLVCLVWLVCLVERSYPDEQNKPDEPDQPISREQEICTCRHVQNHVDGGSVRERFPPLLTRIIHEASAASADTRL